MSEKESSFQRRRLPMMGTRTSPQNGQVITSSGNASLDNILGGGLALNSICLIEEDRFVTHSKVLAKYFFAEGAVSHHCIFYASLDHMPNDLLPTMPRFIARRNQGEPESQQSPQQVGDNKMDVSEEMNATNQEQVTPVSAAGGDFKGNAPPMQKNGMRIAWRYNDLPFITSERAPTDFGHEFDLSGPSSIGYAANVATWSQVPDWFPEQPKKNSISNNTCVERGLIPEMPNVLSNRKLQDLLQTIHIVQKDYLEDLEQCLRICITSLGSPLWHDGHDDEEFGQQLLKFLTILRSIVSNVPIVCFITMPMHLIAKYDETLVLKIRNLVDYSIELETFAGSERATSNAFKDYHGLLHVRKLSAVKTLCPYRPNITDLAFKLCRKRFIIEKFHLPPELPEEENEITVKSREILPRMGCQTTLPGTKESLDF